jgi:phage tail-like protein
MLTHTTGARFRWTAVGLMLLAITLSGAAPLAAQARQDVPRYFFKIEIEGIGTGNFRSVSGLSVETEVIEFREGGDTGFVRKLPGATKFPDLVLKRGFTGNTELYDWATAYQRTGNLIRRSGTIVMYEVDGKPVATWNFTNGWPSKWDGPALNASATDVAVETLVIAHEGLQLVVDQR